MLPAPIHFPLQRSPHSIQTRKRIPLVWSLSPTPPTELVRITPAMTSNTTPSGFIVSQSSCYKGLADFLGYKAFTQNPAQLYASVDAAATPQWVQIELNQTRILRRAVFRSRGDSSLNQSETPSSVILFAGPDEQSLVQIGSASGYAQPTAAYAIFAAMPCDLNVRVVRAVFSGPFSGLHISIGEIELYGH